MSNSIGSNDTLTTVPEHLFDGPSKQELTTVVGKLNKGIEGLDGSYPLLDGKVSPRLALSLPRFGAFSGVGP